MLCSGEFVHLGNVIKWWWWRKDGIVLKEPWRLSAHGHSDGHPLAWSTADSLTIHTYCLLGVSLSIIVCSEIIHPREEVHEISLDPCAQQHKDTIPVTSVVGTPRRTWSVLLQREPLPTRELPLSIPDFLHYFHLCQNLGALMPALQLIVSMHMSGAIHIHTGCPPWGSVWRQGHLHSTNCLLTVLDCLVTVCLGQLPLII